MLNWLEISRANLLHNVRQLRRVIGKKTKLLAVVKANAYGHGVKEVSRSIIKQVDWFGVASLEEALFLHQIVGKSRPILILSFVELNKKMLAEAVSKKITLPLYNLEQAKAYQEASTPENKALVHIKIDTGASRVGLRPEEVSSFLDEVDNFSNIRITGVYSHFADSEENNKYTKLQIQRFDKAAKMVKDRFGQLLTHISCSASSVLHPDSRFDMVRAGIMLYGLHPSKKTKLSPSQSDYVGANISLRPVLAWKSRLVSVKRVPSGCYVGYGLTYKTQKKTKIAVIPVGYADGFDRKMSNVGEVLIKGKRYPVVGRVCMNLSMIDANGADFKVGDEVVIIGQQKKQRILPGDIAAKTGTINYEVVTRINWDLPRILK